MDRATNDIDFFPLPNRTWRPVRDSVLKFGGDKDSIKKCVNDIAQELQRALKELNIASLECTSGRPTSHEK